MNESQKAFRDRLLAAENQTPAYREKYEQELKMIMEHKLTAKKRRVLVTWTVICALIAIVAGAMEFAPASWEFPRLFKVVLVAIAIGVIGKAIIMIRILRRGHSNQADGKLHNTFQWLFVAFLSFMYILMAGQDSSAGVTNGLIGVFMLVFISVYQIRYSIGQSQLQTREKLLKLELQLAELTEQIKPKQ